MSETSSQHGGGHRSSGEEKRQDSPPEATPSGEPPSEGPILKNDQPVYSIFTTWQKRVIVLSAAAGAFFSPLTAQVYFPALGMLAKDFNVSLTQADQLDRDNLHGMCHDVLTASSRDFGANPSVQIFQGITPMFIGSFADATGRRPAYLICFVIYIGANIGCALAPNYAALLVLRMLQSAGSSTTVALCQAVVSDIITSAERGQYVGFAAVPTILAPALGPVIGGLISQFLGWRWIFWFLTILAGAFMVIYALFMPETCRNIVGDGSLRPHKAYRTLWQLGKEALEDRRRAKENTNNNSDSNDLALHQTASRASARPALQVRKLNPFKSLAILFDKEMFLLLMYSSIVFAGFYAVATALPSQLARNYGFDNLMVGLMFLPLGGGSIFAAAVLGRIINWNYQRHCRRLGLPFERSKQPDLAGFPIERARLEIGLPLLALASAVLMGWGWAMQYQAHLAVPCVLLFLLGIGIIGFSNASNVLLVDVNPGHAGSATAANNLTRCLVGAAATAAINPMIDGIGDGWAFFIIGALSFAGAPSLLLIMKHGVRWRKEKEAKERAKKDKK
ncbi:major facilitator superfamily transporter [Apiospora hydei]|uniref:Major facilitator superfamily transporter n=1 Tax=Apiospora hydei TaxID=1337664 RepID=A0ABR1W9C4_9PEZI